MSSTKLDVRVRFAPSPTGLLHIGGMRSALFNWLWARHTGGTFVLRLEDTDRNRLVEESAEQIYRSHAALGITPDEGPQQGGPYGPYVQSERLDIYRRHADQLVETGALYPCWCSPERLTSLREQAQQEGRAFKYDRHCLQPGNQQELTVPHVLRFRIPDEPQRIGWDDAIRGHNEFDLKDLDDFVALKADGFPTYHLAHVIDDHLMKITHVLRADEWLPSTPKHLLLWEAFGWDVPIYGHLPAVQGPTGGKKLSKRDGAEPVEAYIEQGYLPEALRSFLATLGWNDGTTDEVYPTDELVKRFTLDRIQKSPARFDVERLTWINGYMIRAMLPEDLLQRTQGFWPASAKTADDPYLLSVLQLVQDRLKFLAELPDLTEFFFTDPEPDIAMLTKQLDRAVAQNALLDVIKATSGGEWTEAGLEAAIRPLAEQLDLKTGQLFGLIRVALTGRTAAPGLFETLAVLGQETALRRLNRAAEELHSAAA
jgi:glutamyl-tRNA synthetase